MKELNSQSSWTFELGTNECINVSILIIMGFQQRDRQDSQNLIIDTFCRQPVTRTQIIIGTEKYTDSRFLRIMMIMMMMMMMMITLKELVKIKKLLEL